MVVVFSQQMFLHWKNCYSETNKYALKWILLSSGKYKKCHLGRLVASSYEQFPWSYVHILSSFDKAKKETVRWLHWVGFSLVNYMLAPSLPLLCSFASCSFSYPGSTMVQNLVIPFLTYHQKVSRSLRLCHNAYIITLLHLIL